MRLIEPIVKESPLTPPPWTADITYWISGQKSKGTAQPEWDTPEGYIGLCRELGVLPYYWYDEGDTCAAEYDQRVSVEIESKADKTYKIWTTPAGQIYEESIFLKESSTYAVSRHAVNNYDDLKVLIYLIQHRKLLPSANLSTYHDRLALWSEAGGVPTLMLPRSPLVAFMVEWAGIENGVFLIMDHQKEINELFELMEKEQAPVIDAVCSAGPLLVHFPENLSGENFLGFYDEYMEGVYRRRLQKLQSAGVKSAIHLDGTVRGMLRRLAQTGFDCVEAVTPKPVGDVSLEEMRQMIEGTKTILWGGIPGSMFAAPFTWNDMERHLMNLLEAWEGIPFIIGVADQIPPDGDISFCENIRRTIDEKC